MVPATASAQGASQDRVAAAIGKEVTVTMKDGTKYKGSLRAMSGTEVVLKQSNSEFKFPLDTVTLIQRNSHAIRQGALIGFAAGVAFGVMAAAADSEGAMDGAVITIGGLGAGVGAIVGAGIRGSDNKLLVYRGSTKTTVSISPAICKSKVGLSGTIKW